MEIVAIGIVLLAVLGFSRAKAAVLQNAVQPVAAGSGAAAPPISAGAASTPASAPAPDLIPIQPGGTMASAENFPLFSTPEIEATYQQAIAARSTLEVSPAAPGAASTSTIIRPAIAPVAPPPMAPRRQVLPASSPAPAGVSPGGGGTGSIATAQRVKFSIL